MQKYSFFGYDFYIFRNVNIYGIGPGTEFNKGLEKLLAESEHIDSNSRGITKSTVEDTLAVERLPDSSNLIYHICKNFQTVWSETRSLKIIRIWANKMLQGSEGTIHDHPSKQKDHMVTCVGIYYYQVPKDSANLVFVNPGIDWKGKPITDIDPKHVLEIEIEDNMMILHDPMMPHGITTHKNTIPRISIIFEIMAT